jgi:acetyltransferase
MHGFTQEFAQKIETAFTTEQGTLIQTRLIQPEDAPLLIDLFQHLSPQTRRRRFNVGLENIEPKMLEERARELAEVDNQTQSSAILAFATQAEGSPLIGVARLARNAYGAPGAAEIAVVVRDDYQGQGIGTHLLTMLVQLAQQMGFTALEATVQADNHQALSMTHKTPFPVQRHTSHGETHLLLDLTQLEAGA